MTSYIISGEVNMPKKTCFHRQGLKNNTSWEPKMILWYLGGFDVYHSTGIHLNSPIVIIQLHTYTSYTNANKSLVIFPFYTMEMWREQQVYLHIRSNRAVQQVISLISSLSVASDVIIRENTSWSNYTKWLHGISIFLLWITTWSRVISLLTESDG